MRRKTGSPAANFRLLALDGTQFELASLMGRPYLLSFFRFAACPFCNLRMHQLVKRRGELDPGFAIVAVFDSTLDNLRQHATRHESPFTVLADSSGSAYALYGIEHSLLGVMKGMILRMPTLLYAMFGKGYIPRKIEGSMTTMPADFLVDARGVIRYAHYGKDEGDHLPFDEVKRFSFRTA